jgi:energy-coupling factor transporter transmembrane protein EcfT
VITYRPTAGILLYIFLIILVFISGSVKIDLIVFAAVLAFALRLPMSKLKRGVVPITLFVLFTFLSNLLYQTGRIMFEVLGVEITYEGVERGGHLSLRLLILILGAKVLTSSVTPHELIRAMSGMLGPVGKLRPVRGFVFTMSLTLRFLPVIYDEAKILYRESSDNSPNAHWVERIKSSASLLTPLFERSMKKARELSKDYEWLDKRDEP